MSESPARKSPLVPLLVAVIAAVALVAALVGTLSGSDDKDKTSATKESQAADTASELARREADDPLAKGDEDAPVVLVAYADFQCSYCGKWSRETAPTLEKKYVDDGTLRIEWRDFPYLGEESTTAARAARAAGEQGKFWEFHDALYAQRQVPNSGRLEPEALEKVAEKLGLDIKKFRTDMDSEATKEAVAADFEEGQSLGVSGTPSFVVNDIPVVGAQPIETFEQAIEDAQQ